MDGKLNFKALRYDYQPIWAHCFEGIRIHQQIRRYPPAALAPCAQRILWQGSTHVTEKK